jgi:DNA primase
LQVAADAVELEVGDRSVRITNPGRLYFPARGETKLDLARYYMSVGDGIVRALRERPCMMHRFPTGVAGEKVHQKRIPHGAPPWLETVRVDFPRYGRHRRRPPRRHAHHFRAALVHSQRTSGRRPAQRLINRRLGQSRTDECGP